MTNDTTTLDRLNRQCREIAEELKAYYDGRAYEDAEGIAHIAESFEDLPEDSTPLYLSDYIGECLDVRATINHDGSIWGALVTVCCGGPNIYIDTAELAVMGYWGADQARYPLTYEVCGELDECVTELFDGVRVSA